MTNFRRLPGGPLGGVQINGGWVTHRQCPWKVAVQRAYLRNTGRDVPSGPKPDDDPEPEDDGQA